MKLRDGLEEIDLTWVPSLGASPRASLVSLVMLGPDPRLDKVGCRLEPGRKYTLAEPSEVRVPCQSLLI